MTSSELIRKFQVCPRGFVESARVQHEVTENTTLSLGNYLWTAAAPPHYSLTSPGAHAPCSRATAMGCGCAQAATPACTRAIVSAALCCRPHCPLHRCFLLRFLRYRSSISPGVSITDSASYFIGPTKLIAPDEHSISGVHGAVHTVGHDVHSDRPSGTHHLVVLKVSGCDRFYTVHTVEQESQEALGCTSLTKNRVKACHIIAIMASDHCANVIGPTIGMILPKFFTEHAYSSKRLGHCYLLIYVFRTDKQGSISDRYNH